MKGINETLLLDILNTAYPGCWFKEYKAIENRKFRSDAASPSMKVSIEIEGGIWMGKIGGHTSGLGYEANMEKYNAYTLAGWRVLRYSPQTLKKHPEKILLDVMEITGKTPEKLTTKNDIRAKISETNSVQVKLI